MATTPVVNVTGGYEDPKPDDSITVLYIAILLLSVILNAALLVVIRHQRDLQENMGVLYQLLAVSNMFLGFNWSTWLIFWFSHKETCFIISLVFTFVTNVTFYSVMSCLCAISLNLYLLVMRPLRYYTIVTRTRFYFALGTTFLVIMVINGVYLPIPASPFMRLMINRCLATDLSVQADWTSLMHTVLSVTPVCATMVFTTVIYVKLLILARKLQYVAALPDNTRLSSIDHVVVRESRNQPSSDIHVDDVCQSNPNLTRPQQKRFKGFLTIFLLSGSFCAVWVPYVIMFIKPLSPSATATLDKMSMCVVWLQPIIYLVTNSEARRMCLTRCRKHLGIDIHGIP